ncbi:MAG: GNAT family N-acetyltransferase [Hyphomicrobiales bacterium]|nr:MAG: GNAT family N-acetyltransferase [Hyphomicrobiales bacterium]
MCSVRLAHNDDLPRILSLYAQLSPGDLLPDAADATETWQRILTNDMMSVHVAAVDDVVAATCVLIVVPNLTRNQRPFALIENVVSDAALRGRGLGKSVVQAAVSHAFVLDCYKVMLMTGRSDPAVLGFYEACGFQRGKTAFQIRNPA